MNSSNEQLMAFANTRGKEKNPGFISIVAFDYYDGPEQGLAIYPSGAGVRFSSLGDSRSRLFRAFSFVAIDGDWLKRSKDLQELSVEHSSQRIFLPMEESKLFDVFEQDVSCAAERGYYVGVGSPTLDCLSIATISNEALEAIRKSHNSVDSFHNVHQLIKDKKQSK